MPVPLINIISSILFMLKKIVPFALIGFGIIWFGFFATLPQTTALKLIQEGGPIETATAVLMFLGTGICAWRYLQVYRARLFWIEFGILFFAMGVRELDPHRMVGGFNFLNGSFYFDPQIHFAFKAFFAVSLLCLFGTILHFFLTNLPLFLNSLNKRHAWAFAALGFIVAEFTASTHHAIVKFAFFSLFHVTENKMGILVKAFEEPFELIAAILLCWTVLQIPHELLTDKD